MATEKRPPIHQSSGNAKKKRRRGPVMRFRMSTLILLWIGCFIICFGVYMVSRNLNPEKYEAAEESAQSSNSEVIPNDSDADTPNTPTDSSIDSQASNSSQVVIETKINPVPEGTKVGADYLDRCAFAGDTNIYRIGQMGMLKTMNVYASETLNLDNYTSEYFNLNNTQIRLLSALSKASCPIYLMFGTENLAADDAKEAADHFSSLLNAVKQTAPEAEILVLSIPPVTAAAETAETPILNSNIDAYNSLLLEFANAANVYFVDTNTALKANDGKLNPAYAAEDGIHLNKDGAQALLDYVLCHVPA